MKKTLSITKVLALCIAITILLIFLKIRYISVTTQIPDSSNILTEQMNSSGNIVRSEMVHKLSTIFTNLILPFVGFFIIYIYITFFGRSRRVYKRKNNNDKYYGPGGTFSPWRSHHWPFSWTCHKHRRPPSGDIPPLDGGIFKDESSSNDHDT